MPHIAVLASPKSYYARALAAAAARIPDCRLTAVPFSEIQSTLTSEGLRVHSGGVSLPHCDAILVRAMPPGSLEQVVFRMDALIALENQGVLIVNSPRAMETSVDKYLSLTRLSAAGLPTPPTSVCQTIEQAMEAFQALGGDVVVKPIFGSEGRGMMRVADGDLAYRAFTALVRTQAVVYLQPFLPHPGFDVRVLVLGDRMWAMKRRHDHDWRTNLSRGARAEPHPLTESQRTLAQQARDAVGGVFVGVDLLPQTQGRDIVLEVNAAPGWRGLEKVCGHNIADALIRHVLESLATRRQRQAPRG